MVDRSYRVYVIQGQTERDWSDCRAALAQIPARVTALPYIGDAEALIARHEVEKLRLAIPQEVRSAVTSYTIARERVARFEEAFLRQAREARHAAEVSFREGAVSLLEFLEAERTRVQTEREHLAALRDVNTAAFDVTRAAALEGSP